ncbi:MAG: sigma 54-interacting transcriptional regulator [Deltaproteobacteria bacterium]|jgi:formate hydrogenlyase transcriptional activator|nr:sigma 54-interacting transcriptional regulator [Deltaproteobacteria bacterium]MBT4266629.1 sigma 54-interacting transcriptional regulator [Deltaproteobacteria bacterium]MBT4642563.1 sigma 54-interacting transcriptional regulator [Deltaproteobacteria bacterium]MBT6501721.1 sigma 54-interacting transcriptional regulator [Deltaproteobacteria bacterium]MBT7154274.1 sigma 54-interacting transcriptional regulator [Deltaproteobacteria bacterium]
MTVITSTSNHNTPQRILALAALFNSEFSINWLQALSGEKPQCILEALDLGLKETWLESDRPGFYRFTDIQQQAGLIDSLPSQEREELHLRIADILQQETLNNPEVERILAQSLLNIKNDVDGCRQLLTEGKIVRGGRSGQAYDALIYYDKAIEDLGQLEGAEADWLLLDATLEFAQIAVSEADSSKAIAYINEALQRADSRGFDPYRALLKMYLGRHEFILSEFESAMEHFEEGWEMARQIKDEPMKQAANLLAVFFLFYQGRYREAVELAEEFVPEVDGAPHTRLPMLQRPLFGICMVYRGEISQGLGMVRSSVSMAQKARNTTVSCQATVALGHSHVVIGRYKEGVEFLESALKLAEDGENLTSRIGALLILAEACHKLGNNKRALAYLEEFQKLSHESGWHFGWVSQKLDLCWFMEQGLLPQFEGFSLEDKIAEALGGPNVFTKGMAYRYKALMAKKAGRPDLEVFKNFSKALEWLKISGHRIGIATVKLELAEGYLERGDEEKARAFCKPAIQFLQGINPDLIPKDLRHLKRAFRTSEEMLREILQLGQELVTIRDKRKLVARIISTASYFTGAERGAIFLVDKNSDKVVLHGSINLTSEQIESPIFNDSMKSVMEAVHTGETQKMNFDPGSEQETSADDSICSCICIPMFLRNRVFGVLYHDHLDSQKAFQETDPEVLNYFATQAAIALDNVQTYQALAEMVEEQKEQKQYYKDQYLKDMGFENIVGKSEAIQQVFQHIESVAATDSTVLIQGETGVGKELVARAIHDNSSRKSKAFVSVNCSAFTKSLITSELFGHEKGAFTGAFERVHGRFELADGGTLFLDEIGDIPHEVQVRLLRVLQTREFERVGGHETLRSDFRLLVATNKNLEKEVQAGRFREDLYFRLNVFPIHVPPLRERKADIPLLAYHFLNICTKKLGRTIETISKFDLDKLVGYHWPGNIRELENMVERGVILSSGPELIVPDIGVKTTEVNPDSAITTLEENERSHILRALKKTSGKVAGRGGAAEILGINPNTLRHRLKKLGIHKKGQDIYSLKA